MLEDLFKPTHLIAVLAIVAIMFPTKIAGLGGALGRSIRDFKKAVSEPHEEPRGAAGSKTDA
jgi:TatA/E family protein of Tat protein translocase